MLQKIQRFGGAMFAPAMLFSISGLMVGVSALATTADIVGDLAVYGTPWYVFWAIIQRGSWTVFARTGRSSCTGLSLWRRTLARPGPPGQGQGWSTSRPCRRRQASGVSPRAARNTR